MAISKRGASFSRFHVWLAVAVVALLLVLVYALSRGSADVTWPHVAVSEDGTPISYEVRGSSEPTLVFVHGWSCDARYWRAQVPHFSRSHQMVTLDLAGHGHSGLGRDTYSMVAFGQDVRAVVEAVGSDRVILIGHSMGGPVVAEAARLMPDRVLGVIGVDTFQNVEAVMSREELDGLLEVMRGDFREVAPQFVDQMLDPETDPALREWIIADMSAATPAVALSAMEQMMTGFLDGEAIRTFGALDVPVVAVNADLWPTDVETNRRHMASFEAIILEDTDHFLMMNQPERFNRALERAIRMVLNGER